MNYYSIIDNQNSGSLMHIGRNSTTLDEMFEDKLYFHSDLNEECEQGETIRGMYHNTIEGKVECCFDFETGIVKHSVPFSEADYEDQTEKDREQNAEAWHSMETLTFEQAVKEFEGVL